MENWVQHILLVLRTAILLSFVAGSAMAAEGENKATASAIDSEFFDVGFTAGVVNIEDFGSEFIAGINATFNASEKYFLQFNWMQADVSDSAYEESQGSFYSGDDRTFTHYDVLLGYNVLQGEIFTSEAHANLSSVYLVGGVGETEFGGENRFTYVFGVGYQMALARRFIMRFDNRYYIYDSVTIEEDEKVYNNQLSAGIGFLF